MIKFLEIILGEYFDQTGRNNHSKTRENDRIKLVVVNL